MIDTPVRTLQQDYSALSNDSMSDVFQSPAASLPASSSNDSGIQNDHDLESSTELMSRSCSNPDLFTDQRSLIHNSPAESKILHVCLRLLFWEERVGSRGCINYLSFHLECMLGFESVSVPCILVGHFSPNLLNSCWIILSDNQESFPSECNANDSHLADRNFEAHTFISEQ